VLKQVKGKAAKVKRATIYLLMVRGILSKGRIKRREKVQGKKDDCSLAGGLTTLCKKERSRGKH